MKDENTVLTLLAIFSVVALVGYIVALISEKRIINNYGYVINRWRGLLSLGGIFLVIASFILLFAGQGFFSALITLLIGILLIFLMTITLFKGFDRRLAIKLSLLQLVLGVALSFRIGFFIFLFFMPKSPPKEYNTDEDIPDTVHMKNGASLRVHNGRVYFKDGKSSRLERVNATDFKDQYGNYYRAN